MADKRGRTFFSEELDDVFSLSPAPKRAAVVAADGGGGGGGGGGGASSSSSSSFSLGSSPAATGGAGAAAVAAAVAELLRPQIAAACAAAVHAAHAAQVQSLQAKHDALLAHLARLEALVRAERLERRATHTIVHELQGAICDVTDDIGEIKADIKEIQISVEETKSDVKETKSGIEDLPDGIAAIKSDVENVVHDVSWIRVAACSMCRGDDGKDSDGTRFESCHQPGGRRPGSAPQQLRKRKYQRKPKQRQHWLDRARLTCSRLCTQAINELCSRVTWSERRKCKIMCSGARQSAPQLRRQMALR